MERSVTVQPKYPDTVHYTGLNRPTHLEATAHDLYVEGEIPAEIDGAFFRALHDPAYVPLHDDDVVLSRDGVIGKIEFKKDSEEAKAYKVSAAPTLILIDPTKQPAAVLKTITSATAKSLLKDLQDAKEKLGK